MDHENIITWNLPNWITIILMAMIGYAFIAWVAQIVRGRRNGVRSVDDQTDLAGGTALSNIVG